MSHPIINVGRYHGGSDDWRTPYRLFHNLHREFNFSLDGAATEHDGLVNGSSLTRRLAWLKSSS